MGYSRAGVVLIVRVWHSKHFIRLLARVAWALVGGGMGAAAQAWWHLIIGRDVNVVMCCQLEHT